MFNGATCNATASTGCGQAPHTVTAGFDAFALGVNAETDTIYVANFAHKNAPFAGNTISVIDGATCNATTTTGCGQHPSAATAGFSPYAIAFDPATRAVAVTTIEDTSVSVINAATCNATDTAVCHRAQPKFPVGRAPGAVTIDPMVGAVYTSNGDDTVSIIPVAR